MRIMAAVLALLCGLGAAWGSELRIREVFVCASAAQVKRFVELGADGAAVAKVNLEAGSPDMCVVTTAAFVATDEVAQVRRGDATYVILRLMVFGLGSGGGVNLLAGDVVWYTLARRGGSA
jgi:hypothetical protein